jgi:hypothetical protein
MLATPRTMIRAIGIALAITAGVVCSSARASAGCGDYVHIADRPAEPTGEAMPLPANHDREDLPHPPCHGPGCSNRPYETIPPLTAPVTESGGVKELAARSNPNDDRPDGSSRHRTPHTIGSPVHLPPPIFDPPRAA